MRRRVVITGCGVLSALGTTAAGTWEGLCRGRVGIGPLTLFDVSRERTCLAAQVPPFEDDAGLDRRRRRRLSRGDRLGLRAAADALRDAGLEGGAPGRRTGVLIGGGAGALLQAEDYLRARLSGPAPPPSAALGFFPATTADLIAARFGCEGTVDTVLTACSASAIAIGRAGALIASGEDEVMLAGGVEALSRTTYSGFNALRLVDPEPCRPFDRERRGLSLGECAAILVLEERGAARARGARVYAEVAGCGLSADAHHATAPSPDGGGIARAMRAALAAAGRSADDIDHINAHGTGTEQNDPAEARGIAAVFGARTGRLPVTSIKGMVGHCLGAAGAIEAFATARALHDGLVPPTAGWRSPDPACPLHLLGGEARPARLRVALSLSLAFGGNNAALLLARDEA